MTDKAILLSIDEIKLAWFNPRECRDPETLAALEKSIAERGILDPIHVVRFGDEYLCIEGGARLLAARKLGIERVPVRVYEVGLDEAMKLTGELQLSRDDLTPAEKGKFITMLVKKGIFKSVDDAAKYYNLSPKTVYDWVKEHRARVIIEDAPLPKPVAKELVSLPREVRKPIIQEVKDIPNPELQKRIVKAVKREVKERMAEEPEEVKEIVRKVVEKVAAKQEEVTVKGAYDYNIWRDGDDVIIMQMTRQKSLIGQLKIPVADIPRILRALQSFG
jgi:ParB family chromosome partitioning protein